MSSATPTLLHALAELRALLPVVAFLAAILVIGGMSEAEGLFRAAGATMARAAGGRPRRLLALVMTTAALVTAVLGLDATVVLLTPVVFATAARAGVRPRPHVYACTHVANSGSLLLPVSNLTNLLALNATGLSFLRFAALMAAPWAVCLVVEHVALRTMFATDLSVGARPDDAAPGGDVPATDTPDDEVVDAATPWPRAVLAVLAVMLAGFVLARPARLDPSWVAVAAAVVLAARAARAGLTDAAALIRLVNPRFLLLVVALGLAAAVAGTAVGDSVTHRLPAGGGLGALLAWALAGAVLANLVNNLPAAMLLITLAAPAGAPAVLAVLIGVNVGPNLTYYGSLATLLWRRIVHDHDHEAPLGEFTRIGLLTVPVSVPAATVALWGALSIVGG